MRAQIRTYSCCLLAISLAGVTALGQNTGNLRGTVTLKAQQTALHHATVSILQLDRRTETKEDGTYEFTNLPPGTYDVVAHVHALLDDKKSVRIAAGQPAELNFALSFAPYRQQVTVTASGKEELAIQSFQSVTAIDSLELANKNAPSLGEVLDKEPGIAKRSFGPGTSRPVIRGFDGDRVLVLQDGQRTGTLSSQSGDHGEPIDTSSLERLEVVRGPATLLYGSNAIGGVVNAITNHHQLHSHPHEGLRGYMTGGLGSTNTYGAGSGGFEYGVGRWLLWGKGGAQRTGDYGTPIGQIPNSGSRVTDTSAGLGRYGDRTFFSFGYTLQDGLYGIPSVLPVAKEEGDIDVGFRRHNVRLDTGLHNGLGPAFDQFTLSLNYSDWKHRELHGQEVGTRFSNKQFSTRAVLDQKKKGRLSGSLGFAAMNRAYKAEGEEALSPPVDQNMVSVFGLEEIQLERVRLQAGGRLEHNSYSPVGLPARSFTGFSGAAGIHIPLWRDAAAVANYTHSYRAPALEELYNNGPHLGNLTFEIGNNLLAAERSNGLDLAFRQQSNRIRGEVNLFYYSLSDYVYLAPTGSIEEGLIAADYSQADARYMGAEVRTETQLHSHLWLLLGFDVVDAQLKLSRTPLPRIPPVRGRVGVDVRAGALSIRPELILANEQQQLFPGETRTAGYGLLNLNASYTRSTQHTIHVFAFDLFNATDQLYRNHLSFIKDYAPEIGRGARLTYTLRFF